MYIVGCIIGIKLQYLVKHESKNVLLTRTNL